MIINKQLLYLSWQRAKFDLVNRSFIKPFELEMLPDPVDEWLNLLENKLSKNHFYPMSAFAIDVPKQKGALRLGAFLNIEDVIVYTFLFSKNHESIAKLLEWSKNSLVYSHALQNFESPNLIENPFQAWENFAEASISMLDKGYNFVLFTDITAFYENININLLISDLSILNIPKEEIDLLAKCLYKWSPNNCDSLPQGYSVSDIFSNIYLNNIDLKLCDLGFNFLRYGDDYRFFCKTIREAKKAQMILIQLLRSRCLNLQNEKTIILNPQESRLFINGIIPTIENVKENMINDIVYSSGYKTDYFGSDEENNVNIEIEEGDVIIQTFDDYFINDNANKFNKTLFRFCLNKLALKKEDFAADTCILFLKIHPEETEYILKYFKQLDLPIDRYKSVLDYINSDDAIYSYQIYQIFNWILKCNYEEKNLFLNIAKKLAFDLNSPFYLKTVCMLIIGEIGSAADLERTRDEYKDTLSELEKMVIIYSIRRMERTSRNRQYGHIKNNTYLIDQCIKKSKQFSNE